MSVEVQHDSAKHKFYAIVDGREAYLEYDELGPGKLDYKHTYVPEDRRGMGLGALIVDEALAYAKENDFVVVPSCPFVKSFIDSRPEYRELVA